MVRAGLVIFLGAILTSIGIAIYAYSVYQPNFVTVNQGESIQVGPVKYIVTYEGTHNGDEKTRPVHTFLKIRIVAENVGEKETRITGGQFYIIDENGTKRQPVYGEFSQEDLLNDLLEINKPGSYTTQFDIPFYEEKQYQIGIIPTKEQASTDIGIVCLINC